MSITTIDPNTALVVIDLQGFTSSIETAPYTPAAVTARATQLAAAFRKRSRPVVLVNVAGGAPGRTEMPRMNVAAFPANWADLVPELDRQPTDILVTKYCVGAFYGTSLDLHLRRRGVTQVVMCGIATGSGVEATARGAFDRGYHVTFAIDAMADRSAEIHAFCVANVFPRLGETGTTADILGKL